MANIKNKERKSIKAAAKSQVAEIFAVEDAAQQKAMLEDAFEEAKSQITELESALESATEEKDNLVNDIEALRAEKEELEQSKKEADTEKDKLQKALDDATKQIEELTKKIEDMEKDAAMNLRIGELESLGLLFSKEKLAEKQKSKVRELSEEEYADYKDELLELREGWDKETADDGKKPDEKKSKNPESEEDNVDDADADDVDETADADDTESDDDSKPLSAAKLREIRRASAALNKPSSGADIDEYGVDLKLKAKFDKIWENEEEK